MATLNRSLLIAQVSPSSLQGYWKDSNSTALSSVVGSPWSVCPVLSAFHLLLSAGASVVSSEHVQLGVSQSYMWILSIFVATTSPEFPPLI